MEYNMNVLFPNQDLCSLIFKHKDLPIYVTDEFRFYRCVPFNSSFYGRTVSLLHNGNLRPCTPENRHSKLFPNLKVSYWADSPQTARAEVRYHNASNNTLMFFAYDDATSTFPTLPITEPLVILDGRDTGFSKILEKIDRNEELTKCEVDFIELIESQNPDCLVYKSLRKKGGLNYLFFEKGFHKLAIREVRLRLGDAPGKNHNCITCAGTSDYTSCLENYGCYFGPLAKVYRDISYTQSEEYCMRSKIFSDSLKRIGGKKECVD